MPSSRRVLITAGPTHEPIDSVRFVGNRSSGKMGFALAAEAAARGARVMLLAGPSALPTPLGVERVDVVTAAELAAAVRARAPGADAVVMAAAVADYRPVTAASAKLKKEALGARHVLELERTEDILAGLGKRAGGKRGARSASGGKRPLLVGFAAETGGDLAAIAEAKRAAKGCDLLVANDVSAEGAGFEVDTNRVIIVDAGGGREELPLLRKRQVAAAILTRVAAALADARERTAQQRRRDARPKARSKR